MDNIPYNIPHLVLKIYTKMKRLHTKYKFIEWGKVDIIHPDYPCSNVGLMLLVGKIVTGETHDLLKHLLIADHVGPK